MDELCTQLQSLTTDVPAVLALFRNWIVGHIERNDEESWKDWETLTMLSQFLHSAAQQLAGEPIETPRPLSKEEKERVLKSFAREWWLIQEEKERMAKGTAAEQSTDDTE
jgi:hypothetical protein